MFVAFYYTQNKKSLVAGYDFIMIHCSISYIQLKGLKSYDSYVNFYVFIHTLYSQKYVTTWPSHLYVFYLFAY